MLRNVSHASEKINGENFGHFEDHNVDWGVDWIHLKMTGFWVCSAVVSWKLTDVSEVRTASIIRAMMDAVRRYTSTRLHGYTSQKAVIFTVAALRI
jgi:hypothetical protein